MAIALDPERRRAVAGHLVSFFHTEFDEELSGFRADAIIDLMIETLGPALYNQGVQDARDAIQLKLDDLEGDVLLPLTP